MVLGMLVVAAMSMAMPVPETVLALRVLISVTSSHTNGGTLTSIFAFPSSL
jgi:hypothetical protein